MLKNDVVNNVFVDEVQKTDNFWEVNPSLLTLTPYAQFYKKLGKRRSSNVMKAVWMIYDPKSKAQLSGERSEKDLQKDIATHLLNEPSFDWKDKELKKVIAAYRLDCRTFVERELMFWENELRERSIYQRELPWDTERREKDEMLGTQKKLFEQYLDIKKEVDKERSERSFHGGTGKSLIEKMAG